MATNTTVRFSRIFAAAHRVWNDPGKCRNLHGHNYEVEVEVALTGDLNDQGFVTPFETVKDVIDFFDHTLILDKADPLAALLAPGDPDDVFGDLCVRKVEGVPSTEFMANLLANRIANAIQAERDGSISDIRVEVALRETAGIQAMSCTYRRNPAGL